MDDINSFEKRMDAIKEFAKNPICPNCGEKMSLVYPEWNWNTWVPGLDGAYFECKRCNNIIGV